MFMILDKESVREPEEFFKFFDNRFDLIKEYKEFYAREYKVSQKETLLVRVFDKSLKSKSDQIIIVSDINSRGTYKLILFSKKQRFDYIRFYGDISQEEVEWKSTGAKFINRINQIEFVNNPVNYHLILFGSNKEEQFVRGNLEDWDRKGKLLFIKGNLKEIVERRKEWRRQHPPVTGPSKHYSKNECIKANCIHLKEDNCEFKLLPHNFKEATKLQSATGYCYDYEDKEIVEFIKALSPPMLKERDEFIEKYKDLGGELGKIEQTLFKSNVVTPNFNFKDFSTLISLLNNILHNGEYIEEKFWNKKISKLEQKYEELIVLAKDYHIRRLSKRPTKKAKKIFEEFQRKLRSKCLNTLSNYSELRDNLLLENQLVNKMFDGIKGKIELLKDDLKEGQHIYFRNCSEKEDWSWKGGKSTNYINIGRANGENIKLSPNYKGYYILPDDSENSVYPVYKVIKVNKSSVDLKEINSEKEVRMVFNNIRKYKPYLINLKIDDESKRLDFLEDNLDSIISDIQYQYRNILKVKLKDKSKIDKIVEQREYHIVHNEFHIEFQITEYGLLTLNLFNRDNLEKAKYFFSKSFHSIEEPIKKVKQVISKNIYKSQRSLTTFF